MNGRKFRTNPAAFVQDSTEDSEVVHVCGEVDAINRHDFRDSISRAATSGRPIVVDLLHCTYIGSDGFHVLDNCRGAIGTDITVKAPHHIARLLTLVGLADLLSIRKTAVPQ